MRGYNKGGLGGMMRQMRPPTMAQGMEQLLAQEARSPGSTDPNMLRTALGVIGVNANSPNSIAPRNRNGAMPPPMPNPQQPTMRQTPGFYTPNWQAMFGPSLDRYQAQASQSQQQQQNGFGGGNGPIRRGLGNLFGNLRQPFQRRGHVGMSRLMPGY